jgi:hypothetical protein
MRFPINLLITKSFGQPMTSTNGSTPRRAVRKETSCTNTFYEDWWRTSVKFETQRLAKSFGDEPTKNVRNP